MADKSCQSQIIYLHGFNSSPDSAKAQEFSHYFARYTERYPNQQIDLVIPALPFDPEQAILLLEKLCEQVEATFLVGSSLGGYYACYLAEKYNLKAALVNPAVFASEELGDKFLGEHTNYYTNETYFLTPSHIKYFTSLNVDVLQYPSNFMLLVQTGDEVLDYRLSVEKYARSKQVIQAAGSHSFDHFDTVLPLIFDFFGLASL